MARRITGANEGVLRHGHTGLAGASCRRGTVTKADRRSIRPGPQNRTHGFTLAWRVVSRGIVGLRFQGGESPLPFLAQSLLVAFMLLAVDHPQARRGMRCPLLGLSRERLQLRHDFRQAVRGAYGSVFVEAQVDHDAFVEGAAVAHHVGFVLNRDVVAVGEAFLWRAVCVLLPPV